MFGMTLRRMPLALLAMFTLTLTITWGCGDDASGSEPLSDLCAGGAEISWEAVRGVLEAGGIDYVSQTHALDVGIGLKSGESCHATEPRIDAIFDLVDELGLSEEIPIMTE
jgi:hypothetical protein